jgi:flagellar biogenesis protein FliO
MVVEEATQEAVGVREEIILVVVQVEVALVLQVQEEVPHLVHREVEVEAEAHDKHHNKKEA